MAEEQEAVEPTTEPPTEEERANVETDDVQDEDTTPDAPNLAPEDTAPEASEEAQASPKATPRSARMPSARDSASTHGSAQGTPRASARGNGTPKETPRSARGGVDAILDRHKDLLEKRVVRQNSAATVIQAHMKGHLARKDYHRLLDARLSAVIRIQFWVRRWRRRKERQTQIAVAEEAVAQASGEEEKQAALQDLQAALEEEPVVASYAEGGPTAPLSSPPSPEKAATAIQSVVRGHLARGEVKRYRFVHLRAVTLIQRMFRRFKSRNDAATKIQAARRAQIARQQVAMAIRSAVIIQKWLRGHVARKQMWQDAQDKPDILLRLLRAQLQSALTRQANTIIRHRENTKALQEKVDRLTNTLNRVRDGDIVVPKPDLVATLRSFTKLRQKMAKNSFEAKCHKSKIGYDTLKRSSFRDMDLQSMRRNIDQSTNEVECVVAGIREIGELDAVGTLLSELLLEIADRRKAVNDVARAILDDGTLNLDSPHFEVVQDPNAKEFYRKASKSNNGHKAH